MPDFLGTLEEHDDGTSLGFEHVAAFSATLELVDDVGSTDPNPPQITSLVPAAGSSISRTQTITFSVVDPELASVVTVSIGV